jgi:hypothetical protein
VTARDKIIVGVVAGVVAIAAYWFLLLSPERKKGDDLGKQVAAQRQTLQQAQADATASRSARASYAADYATVARLGKAVPVDDDVPSLVYELQSASSRTGVDFRAIKLVPATTAGASTPAPSTPPASGSGSGSGSKTTPPPAKAGQGGGGQTTTPTTSQPQSSTPPKGPSATTSSSPASQAAAAGLPPGASVGPAGLTTMPFSFTFEGDFFHLSDFFRKLERFIRAGPNKLQVNGRLLTVDGISLSSSGGNFRHVIASVSATAYLVPDAQGLLGGATPTGPGASAGATGSAPTSGGQPVTAPAAAAATTP